jgi:hypothetical protein
MNQPMKKLNKTIIIIGIGCFLISCGPSAEETENMKKAIADSVKRALIDESLSEKLMADSIAAAEAAKAEQVAAEAQDNADRQAASEAARAEIEAAIIQNKADLEAAQIKMQDIKGFKIGRSNNEKENEVRNQARYIEMLKLEIKKLEAELN